MVEVVKYPVTDLGRKGRDEWWWWISVSIDGGDGVVAVEQWRHAIP